MRIIGGEARGRRLFAPEGEDTRPTADRTRESLFNILRARVPGTRVLDLFGGTGALALEAMSRGAESAVICDISPKSARVIERNALAVLGENWRARVTLVRAGYIIAIDSMRSPFDIVFLDPPYRMTEAYARAASLLAGKGLIAEDGVILMERLKSAQIALPEAFEVSDTRIYRDTAVDFVYWRGIH